MTRKVLSAEEDSRGLLAWELCCPAGAWCTPVGQPLASDGALAPPYLQKRFPGGGWKIPPPRWSLWAPGHFPSEPDCQEGQLCREDLTGGIVCCWGCYGDVS